MSCNPNHLHILADIDNYMEPSNRPDIIASIFKKHVKELVRMLFNGYLSGWEILIGQINVIEF